jgi:hypothetical protein
MYVLETATFTATATSVPSFSSNDVNSPCGPVIGDVSVTAVAEASTWAMMALGFVGLGFGAVRRARSTIALSL